MWIWTVYTCTRIMYFSAFLFCSDKHYGNNIYKPENTVYASSPFCSFTASPRLSTADLWTYTACRNVFSCDAISVDSSVHNMQVASCGEGVWSIRDATPTPRWGGVASVKSCPEALQNYMNKRQEEGILSKPTILMKYRWSPARYVTVQCIHVCTGDLYLNVN